MSYDIDVKVSAEHLQRNAYLYIRQSTLRQVVENTESTRRQYNLKQRAIALGWRDEQIQVIDCDQGESGASIIARDGFRSLVSDVSLGRAGIVMGLEVSRLARNSSDWHRLLEICALTGTLILDEEGVYNPAHFNDRLLLGLKGTMSEAELYLIRARLTGGMMNKAKRGELKMRLPVGFEYDNNNRLTLNPDKRVQNSIRLFFNTYRRVGTAGATVKEFTRENISFPKRIFSGPKKGEIIFSRLTISRAYELLKNPRYAGTFAYGIRRQIRHGLDQKPSMKYVEREKWLSFIKNAHVGYITWDEYEENLSRLKANAMCTDETRRCPPREGPALLQGIAVCGVCGSKMYVRYHKRRGINLSPDYCCHGAGRQSYCQSISGQTIDDLIAKLLLEKMSPTMLEVALNVQEEVQKRLDETDRLRFQHVEKAQYDMDLAKRRYMSVDPLNRLVADELEADWNRSIVEYKNSQNDYTQKKEQDRMMFSAEQKKKVLALASDFQSLWNSETTGAQDRKRMVRLLLSDVTLIKDDVIKVMIRYKGGATEIHELPLPERAFDEKKHSPEVIKEIDRLLDEHTDGEVAELLNANGFFSGTGKCFSARRISVIRRAYKIKNRFIRLRAKGLLTMTEICEKYHVGRGKVYEWRKTGKLMAHRVDDERYLYEEHLSEAITR